MIPKHLLVLQDWVEQLRGKPNLFGPGVAYVHLTEDGKAFQANTRCSSVVTLALKRAYPALADGKVLKKLFGRSSPYAADYGEGIEDGKLEQKPFLTGVEPGDMFSVDYDGGFNHLGFTGHSAIIEHTVRTGDFFGIYRIWLATVIDSSASSHGPGDSRYKAQGSKDAVESGGLGRGIIRLLAEPSTDALMGYTWSVRDSSPAMVNGRGQIARIGTFPSSITGVSAHG